MRTRWLSALITVTVVVGGGGAAMAEPDQTSTLEVHAWKQARAYLNTTVDATRSEAGQISEEETASTLEIAERISLSGIACFPDKKTIYAEVYIQPKRPRVDSEKLHLQNLYLETPAGPQASLRVGRGINYTFGLAPVYGNRKTSNYSPVAEVFTEDPIVGVQYLARRGQGTLGIGLYQSMRPGLREIGLADDAQADEEALGRTTVPHLSDRDRNAFAVGGLEGSVRYARAFEDLAVGVSGRLGAMDSADAAFLSDLFPTYDGADKTRLRYGLDATYCRGPYYATLEYYGGTMGGIDTNGWAVLVGAQSLTDTGGPWREGGEGRRGFYARYSQLYIGVPTTLYPVTWDTQQLALSYVLPLHTDFAGGLPKWFQFEYERNTESVPAGADQIPNNLLFVEFLCGF